MKKAQPAKNARAAPNVTGKKATPRAAVAKSAGKRSTPKQAALKKTTLKKATAKKVAVKKAVTKKGAGKIVAPKHAAPKTIDDYIAGFPADVQKKLQQVRATIRQAAPDAQEVISYQMPAFTQQGNVIYFAGYEHHIGIYPAPRGIEQFKQELAAYEGGKGTIKLPHDQPLPLDLIRRIVEFKVRLNLEKGAAKRPRRK